MTTATAAFLAAYERLIKPIEGLYSDDAADRGGETYKGIARRLHPSWEGWAAIDTAKRVAAQRGEELATVLRDLERTLQPLVLVFYRREFWERIGADHLPPALAEELLDTAVNSGTGAAVQDLQRALNALNRSGSLYDDLRVDGGFGPRTLAAVDALRAADGADADRLLRNVVNILQGARYVAITERDESQEQWLRGWLRRVTVEEA